MSMQDLVAQALGFKAEVEIAKQNRSRAYKALFDAISLVALKYDCSGSWLDDVTIDEGTLNISVGYTFRGEYNYEYCNIPLEIAYAEDPVAEYNRLETERLAQVALRDAEERERRAESARKREREEWERLNQIYGKDQ